jgi:hypothetical protein
MTGPKMATYLNAERVGLQRVDEAVRDCAFVAIRGKRDP